MTGASVRGNAKKPSWLLTASAGLLVFLGLHASAGSAAPAHFPLLKRARATVKAGAALDPKLRASLLEELAVEKALWEDEVRHQRERISTVGTDGSEALSRLGDADRTAHSRLSALEAALRSTGLLDTAAVDAALGGSRGPARIYSISSKGSVPLRDLGRARPAAAEKGVGFPEGYADPPGSDLLEAVKAAGALARDLGGPAEAGGTDIVAAKAAELNHDPVALYAFVLNSVRPQHYYGSMKRPETVLRSLEGNDADQAALLAALLRASGFPARLACGEEEFSRPALENHFGVSGDAALQGLLARAGIPFTPVAAGGQIVSYRVGRIWCEVWIPYANFRGVALDGSGTTWLPLDPEFKSMAAPAARRILAEMGLSAEAFRLEYLEGAFCAADPVPPGACATARQALAGRINDYLAAHGESLTYESLSAVRALVAQDEGLLPASLPGRLRSVSGVYLSLPDSLQHRVRFLATESGRTLMDATVRVSDLSGREGVLWYAPATEADQAVVDSYGGELWAVPPYMVNVAPQLLAEGTEIARGTTGVGMGQAYEMAVTLLTPSGDSFSFTNAEVAGAPAGIGAGAGKQAYGTPGPDPVNTLEVLSKLVTFHLDEKARFEEELSVLMGAAVCHPFPSVTSVGVVMKPEENLGLIQSLTFDGVYVDADLSGARAVGADAQAATAWLTLASLQASSLERQVFESYGVSSVSADKAMALAHQQGVSSVHITQANLQQALASLPYGQDVKDDIASWVNAGGVADVPQSPVACLRWSGVGYLLSDPLTSESKYQLAGNLSGGLTAMTAEEILDLISSFLDQFSDMDVNPNPEDATRLVCATWDIVPVGTVGQEVTTDDGVPCPLVIVALDAQSRKVSGRAITFSANGGGLFSTSGSDPWVSPLTIATDSKGEARVCMKLGQKTLATDVQARYVILNDQDTYPTLLGLYVVDVESGGLKPSEAPYALAKPDLPAVMTWYDFPGTYAPLTVLGPETVSVRDQYDNLISNVLVRFKAGSGPTGSFAHGVVSRADLVRYVENHPWPMSDQIRSLIRAEVDEVTDSQGRATAYLALSDALSGTAHFLLETSFHTQDVALTLGGATAKAVMQLEGRSTFEQEYVEAYGVGEPVRGDATCSVRYLYPHNGVLVPVDVPGATVTFRFPEHAPVAATTDSAGSCSTPFLVPATPGRYVYNATAQGTAHVPGGQDVPFTATQDSAPVWVVSLSVDDGGPHYIPAHTSNVYWAPIAGRVQPSAYFDRSASGPAAADLMVHFFGFEGPDSRPGSSGSGSVWMPVQVARPAGTPAGQGYPSGSIPPQCLSAAEWPVQLVLKRSWAEGRADLKSPVKLVKGTEVSLVVSCSSQNCILDKNSDVTATLQVVRKDNSAPISLSDWGVHLYMEDGGHPDQPPLEITPLSEAGTTRTGIALRADQELRTSPYLREIGWLTEGRGSLSEEPEDLLVVIRNFSLRTPNGTSGSGTRSCIGNVQASRITLPALPASATWTVNLDGVPQDGPQGADWQPGTYETPYPDSQADAEFTVTADSSAAWPGIHLEWHGYKHMETEVLTGGLPLGHPLLKGVDLATGTYHLVREDLHRPGLAGGLSLVRTYGNAGSASLQSLGAGWAFNYEVTLQHQANCGVWFASDIAGSAYEFNDQTMTPLPGYHGTLSGGGTAYTLTTKEGDQYSFAVSQHDGYKYLLQSISDPFQNTVQVLWHDVPDPENPTLQVDRIWKVTDPASRTLTFDYQVGRTVATCSDGAKLVYVKDRFGRLTVFQRYQGEALQLTELYGYSENGAGRGNLLYFVDPDNRRTDIEYYDSSLSEEGYEPGGVYDVPVSVSAKYRHVKRLTLGGLEKTRFTYDLRGVSQSPASVMVARAISVLDATGDGPATVYSIGAEGQPLSVTDACGNATAMTWDLAQIVKTGETDALGRVTAYGYDDAQFHAKGDPTSITITPSATHSEYPLEDGSGASAGSVATERHYEDHADPAWHRLSYEKSPDGVVTVYTFYDSGAVHEKTETGAGGGPVRTESYEYDAHGNLTTKSDFGGYTTDYQNYDSLGNARRTELPAAGTNPRTWVERTFDPRGRKTGETSSQGRSEAWTYDDLDRVTGHTVHDGREATDDFDEGWTYSPSGLLAEHWDSAGLHETYSYDAAGRKTDQYVTTPAPREGTVTYHTRWAYDVLGRIASRTDPDGVTHAFAYDDCGRQTGEEANGKEVFSQTLDEVGNVLSRTDHRGFTTEFQYDALYRKRTEIAPLVGCSEGGTCQPKTTWLHDLAGRMTRETQEQLGLVHAYAYDGLGRLHVETLPLATHTITRDHDLLDRLTDETRSPQGLTVTKAYDALGRVTSETRTGSVPDEFSYTTTTAYDDTAGTIEVTGPLAHKTLTQLDALGHPKSVKVLMEGIGPDLIRSFLYDGHGKVRSETDPNNNTTTYTWDGLGRKITQTSPPLTLDGNTTAQAVTTWDYDFAGRVLAQTDPIGVATVHAYDALGRETLRTVGGETVSAWVYHDEVGAAHAVAETDGNGNTVLHDLDGLGREVRVTDQEGKPASFAYDAAGRRIFSTDREGKRQAFEYDALGRLTKTTWNRLATGDGPDLTETVEYLDSSRTARTQDRLGFTHDVISDAAGRKVSEKKWDPALPDPPPPPTAPQAPTLEVGRWAYDGLDRVAGFTDANGNAAAYAYDPAGRKVSETLGGTTTKYLYDAMDHVTEVRVQDPAEPGDPAASHLAKSFTYDAGYRLLSEKNASGPATAYGYDLAGNRLSVTDALGKKSGFTFDARRRLTSVTDPVSRVTAYDYDGNGNRTDVRVGSSSKLHWDYTATNRLWKERRGAEGGPTTTYAYNAEGDRTSIVDPNHASMASPFSYTPDALGREIRAVYPVPDATPAFTLKTIDRVFDALDRPTLVTQTLTGEGSGPDVGKTRAATWDSLGRQKTETDAYGNQLAFTYDANGNRTGLTVSLNGGAARSVTYAYDARNRLTGVTEGGLTTQFDYYYWGPIHSVNRPGGEIETFTYDGADRLLSKTVRDASVSHDVIVSYAYEYDLANRRTSMTESHGASSETTTYTYYDDGALQTVTFKAGTPSSHSLTFDYHASGNRWHEIAKDGGGTVQSTKTYAYNALDQLTEVSDGTDTVSYAYDANGNQISKTAGGVTTTFDYTSRDMLAKVTVGQGTPTGFTYDDLGRRIQKNSGIAIWDGRSLAAELPAGALTFEVGRTYTHGLDLLRETLSGTAVETYTDALGSVGALLPPNGQAANAQHYWYAPFGNFRTEAHPGSPGCGGSEPPLTCSPYTFTGHLYDQESGLYYFGARYYDPETGRFLSQDPVAGDALNPPSLHKYLYAYSSPLNYTDPWGEMNWGELEEHNIDRVKKEKALPPEVRAKLYQDRAERAAGFAIDTPTDLGKWSMGSMFGYSQAKQLWHLGKAVTAETRQMYADLKRGGVKEAVNQYQARSQERDAAFVESAVDALKNPRSQGRLLGHATFFLATLLIGSAAEAPAAEASVGSGVTRTAESEAAIFKGEGGFVTVRNPTAAVAKAPQVLEGAPATEGANAARVQATEPSEGYTPRLRVNLFEGQDIQAPPAGIRFGPPRGGGGDAAARAYAFKVTSGAEKAVYVNNVEFEAAEGGVLVDAKNAAPKDSWYDISSGDSFTKNVKIPRITKQAMRQVKDTSGMGFKGIEWRVADQQVATELQNLMEDLGLPIRVVYAAGK